MAFSDRLRTLRQDNKLTQEDLAEILDVSRQAVYKWESGKAYPTIDKILFLKDHFKISLDYLLGEEQDHMKQLSNKTLWQSFQEFYWNLSRHEQSAFITMAGFIAGIFLVTCGIIIGNALSVFMG